MSIQICCIDLLNMIEKNSIIVFIDQSINNMEEGIYLLSDIDKQSYTKIYYCLFCGNSFYNGLK